MHANQILLSSNRLAIGYLHNLSHTFLKRLKLLWGEIACQNASFSKETAEHQDCPFLTVFFFNHKNFIPKYLDNALTDATNKLHEQ